MEMKTLVLTGGGSAGHVMPCLALLPALREKYSLAYIGTDGIERGLLQGAGVPYYTIGCPKLVRGSLLRNVTLPCRFVSAVRQAKRALRDAHADAVFCAGGYVSLPVACAAHRLGIPAVSHESDSTPGLANRLIARHAARMTASFACAAEKLRGGVCTGAPLRDALFDADRTAARAKYGFDGKKPVLLVFGGGSGSAALNAAVRGALGPLTCAYDVLHICGRNADCAPQKGYLPLPFEQDMPAAYAAADYVLSRAGANTLFELAALKKPALVVPLENRRSRGDQAKNAARFAERGLVRVLPEGELSADTLPKRLADLAADTRLRAALAAAPSPRGNEKILAVLAEVMR